MRFDVDKDLLILDSAAILFVIIIAFLPDSALRVALGLPFVIVFPGYAVVSAAFPRAKDIGNIERGALSLGLGFAVVSLVGLIFNYAPWGITRGPMVYFIFFFTLLMSVVAWYRRRLLPVEERFAIVVPSDLSPVRKDWNKDRFLSVILAVVIVATLGTLGYTLAFPRDAERYTSFYVVGSQGTLEGYPTKLTVGQQGTVTLGIENHEQQTTTYRVEVTISGQPAGEVLSIVVNQGETWTQEISFYPTMAGDKQEVEFLLYRSGESQSYRDLHIWIDVAPKS